MCKCIAANEFIAQYVHGVGRIFSKKKKSFFLAIIHETPF